MTISRETRERIIFRRAAGEAVRVIAEGEGIHRSTVERWLKRWAAEGSLESRGGKAGRPRCTTGSQDAAMRELAQRSSQTCASVRLQCAATPSITTVWRRLREGGLRSKKGKVAEAALEKPAVRQKRVDWCEEEGAWFGWSDRTVFVDETLVRSSSRDRVRRWCTRDGRVTQYMQRSGGVAVGFFGGLCAGELLPLLTITGGMTAQRYVSFLRDTYWPVLQGKFEGEEFRFQQDNAMWHRGKAVREWVATQPDLEKAFMFQPPYSPDLNPIEHVWKLVKTSLKGRNFRTKPQLEAAFREKYEELGQRRDILQKLCDSQFRRINAVLAADGGPTKY